jgi:hypothetical protein
MPSALAASLRLSNCGPVFERWVGPITVVCSASITSRQELPVRQRTRLTKRRGDAGEVAVAHSMLCGLLDAQTRPKKPRREVSLLTSSNASGTP